MRYRPFDTEGQSISAVSLDLTPGRSTADQYRLICAALEEGINGLVLTAGDEAAAEAVRQTVAVVGRRVLILMLRLDLNGPTFERQALATLQASGATYLDAAILDRPPPEALSPTEFAELEAMRASRRVARLGLSSEPGAAEGYMRAMDFDLLAIHYNVASGWPERNLLKHAASRGMTVLGYGYALAAEDTQPQVAAPQRGLARLLRRSAAPAMPMAYDFMRQTPGWSSGQLGLSYALTEPGLASVLVETNDAAELQALARTTEQELPAGVAAQIEIARFAAVARHSAA